MKKKIKTVISANGHMLPKNDMTREGGVLRCAAKAQKDTEMRLEYENPSSPIKQPFIVVRRHKRPFKMAANIEAKNIVKTSNRY